MVTKLAAGFAVVIIFIGVVFSFLRLKPQTNVNKEVTENVDPTRVDITELSFIQGSLSFPSETIPSNMVICAEEVNTKDKVCTDTHIAGEQFTYNVGYSLAVKPGTYEVYAYLPEDPERKAYYNEFVECGLSIECPSHEVIEVQVEAGETVTGIDPQDWYQIPATTSSPQSEYQGQL